MRLTTVLPVVLLNLLLLAGCAPEGDVPTLQAPAPADPVAEQAAPQPWFSVGTAAEAGELRDPGGAPAVVEQPADAAGAEVGRWPVAHS